MDRFLSFRLPLTKVTKVTLLFSFGNCLYCGQAALWKFVTCNCFPLGVRPFIPYRGPQVLLGGPVGQPVGDSAPLLCVCTREASAPTDTASASVAAWLPVAPIWIHSMFSPSLSGCESQCPHSSLAGFEQSMAALSHLLWVIMWLPPLGPVSWYSTSWFTLTHHGLRVWSFQTQQS